MQPILAFNEEEQRTIDTTAEYLKAYVEEAISKFMIGELDIDTEWGDYVARVYEMGLDEMTKVHSEAYARLAKKSKYHINLGYLIKKTV